MECADYPVACRIYAPPRARPQAGCETTTLGAAEERHEWNGDVVLDDECRHLGTILLAGLGVTPALRQVLRCRPGTRNHSGHQLLSGLGTLADHHIADA